MARRRRWPSLFPYTTLFRSVARLLQRVLRGDELVVRVLVSAHRACRIDRALGLLHLLFRRLSAGGHYHAHDDDNGAYTSPRDRKSTRLNSSHANISYAVFCL